MYVWFGRNVVVLCGGGCVCVYGREECSATVVVEGVLLICGVQFVFMDLYSFVCGLILWEGCLFPHLSFGYCGDCKTNQTM